MSGSRTPQGVRGLKFRLNWKTARSRTSHPARGAWIEIFPELDESEIEESRTPQGVRGLKLASDFSNIERKIVAPRKGCVD